MVDAFDSIEVDQDCDQRPSRRGAGALPGMVPSPWNVDWLEALKGWTARLRHDQ